jgi:hypothetical protein
MPERIFMKLGNTEGPKKYKHRFAANFFYLPFDKVALAFM